MTGADNFIWAGVTSVTGASEWNRVKGDGHERKPQFIRRTSNRVRMSTSGEVVRLSGLF